MSKTNTIYKLIDPLYRYHLPPELIATEPAKPRDSSRVMIYNTKTDEIIFEMFHNIDFYIPPHSLFVCNNSLVLPSRITLYKETGIAVECLCLLNEPRNQSHMRIMVNKRVRIGDLLYNKKKQVVMRISAHDSGSIFDIELLVPHQTYIRMIQKVGTMPIPPYLKHTQLSSKSLISKYQTTFADTQQHNIGSIAAPTAGLHFTSRVMKKLKKYNGAQFAYIKLHVGMGTFAPLTEHHLASKTLHTEYYEIPKTVITQIVQAQNNQAPIIAVGTTSVRTLETYAQTKQLTGDTNIFITPPFQFNLVTGMCTNFHLSNTSLMMLVEAFLQHKKAKRNIKELYHLAIHARMRFYSFGDMMCIL